MTENDPKNIHKPMSDEEVKNVLRTANSEEDTEKVFNHYFSEKESYCSTRGGIKKELSHAVGIGKTGMADTNTVLCNNGEIEIHVEDFSFTPEIEIVIYAKGEKEIHFLPESMVEDIKFSPEVEKVVFKKGGKEMTLLPDEWNRIYKKND